MTDDIKTIEVQRYAMRLGEYEVKSSEVREAAEKLAEAVLAHWYPMIPNKTYTHKWSDVGLVSRVNCPSVVQYVESPEDGAL